MVRTDYVFPVVPIALPCRKFRSHMPRNDGPRHSASAETTSRHRRPTKRHTIAHRPTHISVSSEGVLHAGEREVAIDHRAQDRIVIPEEYVVDESDLEVVQLTELDA